MMDAPATHYARGDGAYTAYQVFGTGPPTCLFVTNWLQNLDVMWDEPTLRAYLERLGSFSRVVCFDKRGSGVSDPVPLDSLPPAEHWVDDVRHVLAATATDQVVVIGDTEGVPLALLLAATFPDRVSALVIVNGFARWRRADDYPIGMPAATVDLLVERYEQHWGVTAEVLGLTAPSVAHDARFREWFIRYQRLAMPRGAATTLYTWITTVDVRSILPTIRVPTLVLHRAANPHYRPAFGRYIADSIPGARFVEIPGADAFPFHAGDPAPILDQIELFVTGALPERTAGRRLATVVFTDIVGSTEMAVDRGDAAWLELLDRHDKTVRDHVRLHRGEEMSYTGDGFGVIFDGPARAVTFAERVSRALGAIGVTVRVGIHTGEVELVDGQMHGLAVHVAARVLDAATEGGVLVSSTVKDLVLGSGIEFDEVGTRPLRGVPGEWRLFRVASVP